MDLRPLSAHQRLNGNCADRFSSFSKSSHGAIFLVENSHVVFFDWISFRGYLLFEEVRCDPLEVSLTDSGV
jgi:hypothetical protein